MDLITVLMARRKTAPPHLMNAGSTQYLTADYWTSHFTERGRVYCGFGEKLPLLLNGDILDMGCSYGITTTELSLIYPDSQVIGIDIDTAIIEAAKKMNKRRNVAFYVADGYNFPFEENTFGAVFCMNNICLACSPLAPDRFTRHLRSLGGMVSDGGYFLMSGNGSAILRKNAGKFQIEDNLGYGSAAPLANILCELDFSQPVKRE